MGEVVATRHDPPIIALERPRSKPRGRSSSGARLSDRTMLRLLLALIVFNVIDGVLTFALVREGLATEANPVMARSLMAGPIWFALHKIVLVGGGTLVLWFTRRHRLAQAGTLVCCGVYGILMFVHLWSCKLLLLHLHLL